MEIRLKLNQCFYQFFLQYKYEFQKTSARFTGNCETNIDHATSQQVANYALANIHWKGLWNG